MRIYDRSLAGAGASEAGKASEAQRLDYTSGAKPAERGGSGGDRVELSGALRNLSRAISSDSRARAAKVQALAAQYQSGNYRPDSAAISRAMIAEALAVRGK
jgi:anti-sigma28 factor (negative regulator of flagellin synthesis)